MYNTALSIVIDVSSKQYKNKKTIDVLKKQLIKYLKNIQDENLIYICDKDNHKMKNNRGEQVSMIASYDSQERDDLFKDLKKSYQILSEQDQNLNRILCYITNRFSEKDTSTLKKMLNFNKSKSFFEETCQFLVIALDQCDFDLLIELCEGKADLMLIEDLDTIMDNLEEYFREG